MSIHQSFFGQMPDGSPVDQFTLENSAGMIARIITYGGRLTELQVPDRHGRMANVVLGFDHLEPYLDDRFYFGPVLGRYANRIARGRFTLDGIEYTLPRNEGNHTLHSGPRGLDKQLWHGEPQASPGAWTLVLSYFSAHLDEGFPGQVLVTVSYTLTDANELHIEYSATTDQNTPINLTSHIYINLAGTGDVLDHVVMIDADEYTPTDAQKIPTGEIAPVRQTPLDFSTAHRLGSRVQHVSGGYDLNYVLRGSGMRLAARVQESGSGRAMELLTDQPGIQFYDGSLLDGSKAGSGGEYCKHAGLVLEPQHFPDSVHHPNFPSTLLRPGEMFRRTAIYRFSTR